MTRIGVLGGTFDPIHVGHLGLARVARECVPLDRVLLVPARRSPHKAADPVANAADRLEMCRLAASGMSWLEADGLELTREGASFTVDTLEELHRRWPQDELYLILGWDAALDLPAWHRLARIVELARLVLVPRPGLPEPGPDDLQALSLEGRAVVCAGKTPRVEARELRDRLASGKPTSDLVPGPVAAYIAAHGLYR